MADARGLAPPPLAPASTTRRWLPALQSLRGVAALWVVLYHLQVYLDFLDLELLPVPGIRLGWLGVDLFFVLSAYLLGQPFMDGRAPPTRTYLMDRFLRIAPPYYAAFALTALGYTLFLPEGWIPSKAWWSLVFLQNLRFDTFIAVNPAFWSLAVELQFYLLLPFMARLFRGPRWPAALAGSVAVALAYRGLLFAAGGEANAQLSGFTLPAFLGHFGLGLAACRLRVLAPTFRPGLRRAAFAVGLLLVVLPALLWIPRGSVLFGDLSLAADMLVRPLAACGFALIVVATASGGWVAEALAWPPLDWLGRISYSLYLIHIPVQVLLILALPPSEGRWLWAAAATAGSLLAGWLLYLGVERPSEVWRRRRKESRRAALTLTAPGTADGRR